MAIPVLHYHPLSSYCQKVLIAADVLGVELDKRMLNLGDPAERAAYLALWPLGKMPLLVDDARIVPETSIIIEYLQTQYSRSAAKLIPADPEAALDVRLWDRFFDLHVMTPMQALTADLLTTVDQRNPSSVAKARETLLTSYKIANDHLQGRTWMAGDEFSMADCAAAPALFYAVTYVPLSEEHSNLADYFERLIEHPAVAAVIEDAKPYFKFYPGRAGLSSRFLSQ